MNTSLFAASFPYGLYERLHWRGTSFKNAAMSAISGLAAEASSTHRFAMAAIINAPLRAYTPSRAGSIHLAGSVILGCNRSYIT